MTIHAVIKLLIWTAISCHKLERLVQLPPFGGSGVVSLMVLQVEQQVGGSCEGGWASGVGGAGGAEVYKHWRRHSDLPPVLPSKAAVLVPSSAGSKISNAVATLRAIWILGDVVPVPEVQCHSDLCVFNSIVWATLFGLVQHMFCLHLPSSAHFNTMGFNIYMCTKAKYRLMQYTIQFNEASILTFPQTFPLTTSQVKQVLLKVVWKCRVN